MKHELNIKKVAVLGAGVMGAQIAAHFANANIPVVLFDLKAEGEHQDSSLQALQKLATMNPKPLASNSVLKLITPANYTDNLEQLKDCDLIIEAIAERLDLKEALYGKIGSHIAKHAIMASNTSGLGIGKLASSLPENRRSHFCGIHFFNPPRYMSLVELIPHTGTDVHVLEQVETFLVSKMGKHVVVAKDTPNFIGNRLGIFSMQSTMIHARQFNLPFEVVDALTGKDLGRAKSATFRTADVIGLDTYMHVVDTFKSCVDGFEDCHKIPEWMQTLINNGALGSKTKAGIFKKDAEGIKVLDLATNDYRLADKMPNPEIVALLKQKDWAVKFDGLKASSLPEAQFLWACFRDTFHYASILLGEIADLPRDMDFALRCGFGWKEGLFEIWQQAGWLKVAEWINADIKAGRSLSKLPLPQWVFKLEHGVYQENKCFKVSSNDFVMPPRLPVYKRQIFPELILGETNHVNVSILFEDANVKLWHTGDKIGILSFKTKMCAISQDVLAGISSAIDVAQKQCIGIVIWQEQDVFSVGANLDEMSKAISAGGDAAAEKIIANGQEILAHKLRCCEVPVVAAVRGYALGGGCEIMLHCHSAVVALESSIGLVEANVGLLPGWGGTTEMAYRASRAEDPWQDFVMRYTNLVLGKMAASAREASDMGLLDADSVIVMNSREILFVAKERIKNIIANGYIPAIKIHFPVFGRSGIAQLEYKLATLAIEHKLSEHDILIAKSIAYVMCGGNVDEQKVLSYHEVLTIEKEHFKQLSVLPNTQARIAYMLKNGKALKN